MFRNNLKIAWRNLIKERRFSLLNLAGLSTGLACTLLIYLWVHDEMSFDKFHEKESRIYQLMERHEFPDHTDISDESSGMLGETLAKQLPEIEYSAAIAPVDWFQKFTLSVGEKNLKAAGQYVGKDYFNIFSFPLIEGNKNTVLADKHSILISATLARKLFNGTQQVIGKTIRLQQDQDFVVTGIFEDIPFHSSQQFDFALSFEYYKDIQSWVKNWTRNNTGPHNFVLLKPGTDIASFNRKIADIIKKNSNDDYRKAFALKFSDNYLYNSFDHGIRTGGRIEYVRLFSLIAIFILVIACINFMNLSTARASRRMKEVGIKKVVGAGRSQLIFQFLGESVMLCFFAMVLAFVLAAMVLPAFNQLTGKQMDINLDREMIGAALIITLVAGLLSGSYPALYLSGFNPISILKGKLQTSLGELWARKGLVVFQFTLSVVLIVAVMVVYRQIRFIQTKDPGYNRDYILRFDSEGKVLNNQQTFIAELKKIPGVVNASGTFHNIIGRNFGRSDIDWEGKNPKEAVFFEGMISGYDFIETMNMKIVAGRNFSRDFGDEFSKIIVNETAAKAMGMKDPVGKFVRMGNESRQIIGVVKDFHFESLHETVKPLYMGLGVASPDSWYKILVKINGTHQEQTIQNIEKFYAGYNPGFRLDYYFLDEAYQKQYVAEKRVSALSRYFAGLAILISCLGLFGLAAFTAQRRQKEIGIRKVIGASASSVVMLLSKDFFQLVSIAVLLAFPLSWWAAHAWLNGFAYRIPITADIFGIAAVAISLITAFTVCLQAIRAARANPADSLRSE